MKTILWTVLAYQDETTTNVHASEPDAWADVIDLVKSDDIDTSAIETLINAEKFDAAELLVAQAFEEDGKGHWIEVTQHSLELPVGGVYLHLFHGRKDPNQQMEDWGEDGPVIGPLPYAHTTYATEIKFQNEKGECQDIPIVDDMVLYGGVYYGDWSVFGAGALGEHKPEPFDPAKAAMEAMPLTKPRLFDAATEALKVLEAAASSHEAQADDLSDEPEEEAPVRQDATLFGNAARVLREALEPPFSVSGFRKPERVEEATNDSFFCNGCGREESVCSANPCEAVIADREA